MSQNLATISQEVTLGLNVGQVVIPAITGIIKSIQANRQPDGSIEYTVAISTGQANLDKASANFAASIADIDNQLATTEHVSNATAVAAVIHNPA